MMTLEEAAKHCVDNAGEIFSRHNELLVELISNPDILKFLIVLTDEPSKSTTLIKAMQFGLIIGIEMEKTPQQ